jgi:hypothetical protein
MPAKGISGNWLRYDQSEYELPRHKNEIDIYFHNRICALEQKIKQLVTLLRHQCESCQHKKVAENIKSILG